ncbi:MAG: M14 metallopeptidase family protein [bacterium]
MRSILRLLSVLFLVPAFPATSASCGVPQGGGGVLSPDEFLEGRDLGADFTLADWDEVSGYFRHLAEVSPRVQLQRLGATRGGRDFLMATLSSEENLARLPEIRRMGHRLSDPRGHSEEELEQAVNEGKVVLFISPGMHSTETSPPQFGMQFAYEFATSDEEPWVSARRETVVNLFPCTNPDGLDGVVSWYRKFVGTPYESTGLSDLYQHYAGHDNNRDWFMLSLAETRLVTEQLYKVWRPQVYWDVHEQGSSRERFFVPPFRDPLNPNIDPAVITGIDLLGTRALLDMNREGLSGISTGVSYDMWWTGGNRNVPTRHNIIGLLTEAASIRLGTPLFLRPGDLSAPRGLGHYGPSNRFPNPWPGGWWRLKDVIDYEMAFGRSLLGSLSREGSLWRANSLELARRALERGGEEGPRAWLIPPDNRDLSAVRRLCQALISTGVELHVAQAEFEADGRPWPVGTIVIRRDQPYGGHVKDLFEIQRYPEGDSPYDVAGWTLPVLMGVRRVEVMAPLEVESFLAASTREAMAAFGGDERLAVMPHRGWLDASNLDSWTTVLRGVADGNRFTFVGSGPKEGLFIPGEGAYPAEDPVAFEGLPRIGLYAPWSGHMPEGWMRWVFDNFRVPYETVRNESLRAGGLADWLDVLVLPGVSGSQLDGGRSPGSVPAQMARGLDPEGAVAIEEFVRAGGKLVAVGRSSSWAADLFRLPLVDVTRGEEAQGFSCPGSVVRCIPEAPGTVTTAGLPASVPVFFSSSSAWKRLEEEAAREANLDPDADLTVLARYAPRRALLSGWAAEPERIEGQIAWLSARHGEGSVHLMGFRPQYRSWSQGAFHLLLRALFLP